MRMNAKDYEEYAASFAPRSKTWLNTIKAFCIGGLICVLGEALIMLYTSLGLSEDSAKTLECISLIFLSALCTSLHIYDKIAKHAGAGTLVPITGFANSVVSSAIEFKSEGLILGVGAKIFSIAGPVITYGITASIISGLIRFVFSIF